MIEEVSRYIYFFVSNFLESISPLTCIHIEVRLLTFESPKPIKARLTLTVEVSFSHIKASSTLFCEIVACIGKPWGRSDEEAGQVKVHRVAWPRMDIFDRWRGSWSMQIHASHIVSKVFNKQCLNYEMPI